MTLGERPAGAFARPDAHGRRPGATARANPVDSHPFARKAVNSAHVAKGIRNA